MKTSCPTPPSHLKGLSTVLLVSLLTLSCRPSEKGNSTVDSAKQSKVVSSKEGRNTENWYDPIVADYIKQSDRELIKAHRKRGEKIEWLLDNTEKTDSTNYYIFNIGQTVTDEGHTNPRFSSNGWIYVDSLSKKVYEYDLPNDRLVLWTK